MSQIKEQLYGFIIGHTAKRSGKIKMNVYTASSLYSFDNGDHKGFNMFFEFKKGAESSFSFNMCIFGEMSPGLIMLEINIFLYGPIRYSRVYPWIIQGTSVNESPFFTIQVTEIKRDSVTYIVILDDIDGN